MADRSAGADRVAGERGDGSIPEADAEALVYEQVVLSGDQDGVLGNDCLFQHLEDQVESP